MHPPEILLFAAESGRRPNYQLMQTSESLRGSKGLDLLFFRKTDAEFTAKSPRMECP
jgi:hypothetical protein